MNTVYGPVPSRRLGVSLGIDPVCSTESNKICSFDCVYCQLYGLGPTAYTTERRVYVGTGRIRRDLQSALSKASPDIITISGTGEPTLAKNLREIVGMVHGLSDLPVAILTNSSLIPDRSVREDLYDIGHVVAKLDACSQESFSQINRPHPDIRFEDVVKGLTSFRKGYGGKLSLQMMFIDANRGHADEMAEIARQIGPDEVHINTPLRPCKVKPLAPKEIEAIKMHFEDLNTVTIYELGKPDVTPIDMNEALRRRPGL
ncbi:MAG: radical SAM protein [Candidatus Aenigmarchaeota archaeon]|nr:radical SAM protein [Candidatus Aenigmarchaeota archaeon]